MIAIITYNSIPGYTMGILDQNDKEILILPKTFTPKCPENVSSSDINWQMLLKFKERLTKIYIFAGKKSSGALEIIELATKTFKEKSLLYFILCDHELTEKENLLENLGFNKSHYMVFSDGYEKCREDIILRGLISDYMLDE